MRSNIFTIHKELGDYLRRSKKKVLLVIPAISTGNPGISDQYRDYLDQGAKLYQYLISKNISVDIFLLGAEHRGEGFLHKIGKEYLVQTYTIPKYVFVWDEENFRSVGLCSVEEVQLTHQYLKACKQNYQVVTSISKSQLNRYFLHQRGYTIFSVYYVFSDNPNYFHLQNEDQEKILTIITEKDPTWRTEIGKELRKLAHRLRDPHEPEISPEEIQMYQQHLKEAISNN